MGHFLPDAIYLAESIFRPSYPRRDAAGGMKKRPRETTFDGEETVGGRGNEGADRGNRDTLAKSLKAPKE